MRNFCEALGGFVVGLFIGSVICAALDARRETWVPLDHPANKDTDVDDGRMYIVFVNQDKDKPWDLEEMRKTVRETVGIDLGTGKRAETEPAQA